MEFPCEWESDSHAHLYKDLLTRLQWGWMARAPRPCLYGYATSMPT